MVVVVSFALLTLTFPIQLDIENNSQSHSFKSCDNDFKVISSYSHCNDLGSIEYYSLKLPSFTCRVCQESITITRLLHLPCFRRRRFNLPDRGPQVLKQNISIQHFYRKNWTSRRTVIWKISWAKWSDYKQQWKTVCNWELGRPSIRSSKGHRKSNCD